MTTRSPPDRPQRASLRDSPRRASLPGSLALVAILLGSALAAVSTPVAAAPPDRPPVAWAGDDQTVLESPSPCTTTGSASRDPCRIVTINTRYTDCPIRDRTYDPDCDSLKFRFRTTPPACNPDPLQGGGVPCVPIGDGSKYLDETTYPFRAAGQAVIESVNCKRVPGTIAGQNPDIKIRNGDDTGFFVFTSPQIPPGHAEGCIYSIDMEVYDGKAKPVQPAAGQAGVTDYTVDVDTVVITVKPDTTRPRDYLASLDMLLCPRSMRQVLDSGDATGCDDTDAVDIVLNHGEHLIFGYGPILDDREARSVQILVNQTDYELGYHAFLVPLTEKIVLVPFQEQPHQDEVSFWMGDLPVDTPSFIKGNYLLNTRVYDSDGGVKREEGADEGGQPLSAGELEVTADLLDADGDLGAPCHDPGGNAPCISVSTAPVAHRPNFCFPGATDISVPYVLGRGLTLRPEVTWAYTNPAADDDTATPLFDHGLMGWKFTFQSCVASTVGGQAVPAFGPEVELDPPYYMSLDTLFAGDQEVALRAYDRIGNPVTMKVIPLTDDTTPPVYAMEPRMLHDPVTTYQDLQAQLAFLVHDDVDTLATLHINRFNETATGKAVTYDSVLFSGQAGNRNGTVVLLPRLSTTGADATVILYDVGGKQDFESVCDWVFDQDGDGVLDSYYHWANHTLGHLLADAGDDPNAQNPVNNFVVDANRNGIADVGETLLLGDAQAKVKSAGKCIDPFEDQPHLQYWLRQQPTQVYAFNVTRHLLGETPYIFTIRDVIFGQYAPQRYAFNYTDGETLVQSPVSKLQGTLDTRHAVVDAQVTGVSLVNNGPYLAGDAILIGATATQTSAVDPAPDPGTEPVVDLNLYVYEPGSTDCRGTDPHSPDCLALCAVSESGACGAKDVTSGQVITAIAPRPYPYLGGKYIDPQGVTSADHFPAALVALAASPYRPGLHNVLARTEVPPSVTDADPTNDAMKVSFEVYLGEVVVGAYPANSQPSGDVFWVRTNNNGLPIVHGGVVLLDSAGAVAKSYDLTLNGNTDVPRYEFNYTDADGAEHTAYWEPQARYSKTFGKDCNALSDSEREVDLAATPPKDPQCRPITVITPKTGDSATSGKKSPGPELVLVLAALGLLAFARRRR